MIVNQFLPSDKSWASTKSLLREWIFKWWLQNISLPSSLIGVDFSGALTTGCICCSSRMAHPYLLWLEGLLCLLAECPQRARLDPCTPLMCDSTVTASHQWLMPYSRSEGSSPRRPSISLAVTSSDTTEPYFDFSGGFPEVGSVSDFFSAFSHKV